MRTKRELPESPVSPALLDEARTLTGALEELTRRHPDYDYLTLVDHTGAERGQRLDALWAGARRAQGRLEAAGCRPGQIVLLALPTGTDLLESYVGTLLAGAVPALLATPLNRFTGADVYGAHLAQLVDDAAAPIVWADADVEEMLRAAAPDTQAAVLRPGEEGPAPGDPYAASPDEIAAVQYSSGSTAKPKGVLLTHEAILNNLRATRAACRFQPADVSVNWVPLYHDMGLVDAFLTPLFSGARNVLLPTTSFMRDPSLWLWAIHRFGGTFSIANNSAYALCATRIDDEDLEGLDLSTWRLAVIGAEPVLPATLDAFNRRFAPYGFRDTALCTAWGMAEGVCMITLADPDTGTRTEVVDRAALVGEHRALPVPEGEGVALSTCGNCIPAAEMEIRDEAGRALPERHVGKVWVRTDSLFTGYHGDAEATARVLVDGWLDTGDRGYRAGGEFFFVAREKDLVIIGGENYVPHDIEEVVWNVPGIRTGCAVSFGILDPERGTEELVVVAESKLEDEEALDRLRTEVQRTVRHAIGLPARYVVLVPPGGLLKTTNGKLARQANRERYAEQVRSA